MDKQVTVDLNKPDNVKDGFKVNVKNSIEEKQGIEIAFSDTLESKVGKLVNVQNKDNPKTW